MIQFVKLFEYVSKNLKLIYEIFSFGSEAEIKIN